MKLGRIYYALLQEGTEDAETAHAIAEKAAAIKVMLERVNEKKRRENTAWKIYCTKKQVSYGGMPPLQ